MDSLGQDPIQLAREIARCNREIAEIEAREAPPLQPAYLNALGLADWHWERRHLEKLLREAESQCRS
jgi:hypothetical protein